MIAPIFHLFLHFLILTHSEPDICYAVQHLSQYIQDPRTSHFSAAPRVLRHPGNNPNHGLFLTTDPPVKLFILRCRLDRVSIRIDPSVDFLSLLEARLFLGSRKNRSPFPYPRQMSIAPWEESWLNWHGSINFLIWDLHRSSRSLIHLDSQAAIHIAWNLAFHERRKHVELDCHFVRKHFLAGLFSLKVKTTATSSRET